MFCSWYDDEDIVLSMTDRECLRRSQICCHGNCCRLDTNNLCREKLSDCQFEIIERPVYTGDICCDCAAIFSFEGCEEVNQL